MGMNLVLECGSDENDLLEYLSMCTVDGALWMWGWGARGQLGQGDTKSSNVPVLVEAFK